MVGVRRSLEDGAFASAEDLNDWFATATRVRAQHRAIVEAIVAGDGALASRLMNEHISGFYTSSLMSEAS
jgi:DNA-binding GntR family transcriptional regulator